MKSDLSVKKRTEETIWGKKKKTYETTIRRWYKYDQREKNPETVGGRKVGFATVNMREGRQREMIAEKSEKPPTLKILRRR